MIQQLVRRLYECVNPPKPPLQAVILVMKQLKRNEYEEFKHLLASKYNIIFIGRMNIVDI